MTPVNELVNTLEFEELAKQKLAPDLYAAIAGSDRQAFDRITLRPRMMVDTSKLDLSVDLFGVRHFAPILIGAVSNQKRFHEEGELAMARGAGAAKTGLVMADEVSYPLDKITASTKAPLWYHLEPSADFERMSAQAQKALQLGCQVICVSGPANGNFLERLRKVLTKPLVLKGVMTPADAQAAIQRGVGGIIVSRYRGVNDSGLTSPMEVLPAIDTAVGGKVPIFIDDSFRRGSDILKALALGARAVLVARPVLWALATYGSVGVQRVMEILQSELARDMAMCGLPAVERINSNFVRRHLH